MGADNRFRRCRAGTAISSCPYYSRRTETSACCIATGDAIAAVDALRRAESECGQSVTHYACHASPSSFAITFGFIGDAEWTGFRCADA